MFHWRLGRGCRFALCTACAQSRCYLVTRRCKIDSRPATILQRGPKTGHQVFIWRAKNANDRMIATVSWATEPRPTQSTRPTCRFGGRFSELVVPTGQGRCGAELYQGQFAQHAERPTELSLIAGIQPNLILTNSMWVCGSASPVPPCAAASVSAHDATRSV